jgi:hypothetical protein
MTNLKRKDICAVEGNPSEFCKHFEVLERLHCKKHNKNLRCQKVGLGKAIAAVACKNCNYSKDFEVR